MKKKEKFSFLQKKIQLFLCLLLLVASLCPLPSHAFDIEYPEITVPYAILVDANHDEILFAHNAYEKAYPASITKVMTGLLVAEAIENGIISLDTMVTAQEESTFDLAADGSTQGIHPGEIMSVEDLFHCMMLVSANEACNILGIEIAGDLETFHQMMNDKAEELGCTSTNFINAHGYHHDDHYTTAYDIFLFFKEAMTYPIFAQVVGTATYTTQETNKREERLFYNTNGLLSEWYYRGYSYEYCIGGKTGSTSAAGRCLVSAAEMGNEYVISVVLGATPVILDDGSTLLPQMAESRSLLKFGIEEFDRRIISPSNEPVGQVVVTLSDENDAVLVKAQGEIEKTLPITMDLGDIETEVTIHIESLVAPVVEGTVVGSMTLSYQGEIYGTLEVVTMHDVARSEILYQKEQMENFVSQWGGYMALGAVGMVGAGVGVQYALKQKKRRNSWRNNQKRRYRSRK